MLGSPGDRRAKTTRLTSHADVMQISKRPCAVVLSVAVSLGIDLLKEEDELKAVASRTAAQYTGWSRKVQWVKWRGNSLGETVRQLAHVKASRSRTSRRWRRRRTIRG
jgi:hypothetical protein